MSNYPTSNANGFVRQRDPHAPGRARARVRVDDVDFDAMTEEQVIDTVLTALDRGEGGRIVTPNVDILRQLHDPSLKSLADDAELVLADGFPVVLASRVQQTPLPERVTGSSLILTLAEAALAAQRRILLLGGLPCSASKAAERLVEDRFAVSDLVEHHCPPLGFESSTTQRSEIDEVMRRFDPDIVYVGLGFPKQDLLSVELLESYPRTWFVGCGAAIDMLAGQFERAPVWMQDHGMEWVHRLVQEPGRLYKRYLLHDLPHAAKMLSGAAVIRMRNRSAAGS